MSDILDIGILGADGRMGASVIRALTETPHTRLSAAVTARGSDAVGQDAGVVSGIAANGVMISDDLHAALDACDVLIDFSAPKAAIDAALAMHNHRCRTMVSGTTGFTDTENAALETAAESITLLRSGNFSPGVTALAALVELAAGRLGAGWDIEILDMHHRHKVDAPSGTALLLGEAAAAGRGIDLGKHQILGRAGQTGERPEDAIGFAALRGGGVIGAHEVRIASALEMITLSHDAFDRSVFAKGAVKAAIWAAAQPKGLYNMRDVLGF